MNLYKLTDFGDQEIIIGSRADYGRKDNLRLVQPKWLKSVKNDISNSLNFKKNYGFDEDLFLQKYHLRAVQFGNWMNYNDRADHFLALVQALGDLDKIIHTDNIGYYGKMSVALGARGRGKALAHYEPSMKVINLTKEKGGHSFAHEYGHAIDFLAGEYFSKCNTFSLSSASSTQTIPSNAKVDEVRNLMNIVLDGVRCGERYEKLANWSAGNGPAAYAYWCNNTEIWARTFAQWVALQCREKKIKDVVLCGSVDTGTLSNIPEKELKKLAPYIKKLVMLVTSWLEGVISKPPAATTKNPFEKKAAAITKPKKKAAAKK